MFAFVLAQTATTHNHSFKWIETCKTQWSGAQRQVHLNCVYRYVAGYHKRSVIMGIYKTYVFFYVSCLVMLYLIWRLRAHVSEIRHMLCYVISMA